MSGPIGRRQRLRGPLRLVIDATRPDRIRIAPVGRSARRPRHPAPCILGGGRVARPVDPLRGVRADPPRVRVLTHHPHPGGMAPRHAKVSRGAPDLVLGPHPDLTGALGVSTASQGFHKVVYLRSTPDGDQAPVPHTLVPDVLSRTARRPIPQIPAHCLLTRAAGEPCPHTPRPLLRRPSFTGSPRRLARRLNTRACRPPSARCRPAFRGTRRRRRARTRSLMFSGAHDRVGV